jgi:Lar family restriction alleviation protein
MPSSAQSQRTELPMACPFCGEADTIQRHVTGQSEQWFIECQSCEARGPVTRVNTAHAVAIWNNRI